MSPWRAYLLLLQDHARQTGTYGEMISSDQCCRSVGAKREREREAGARERIFQKMVGSEASPERFYIYIYKYIYIQKKTCRMPNMMKIYETCMFVILPI
jgi:hypothetical protein